MAISRCGGGYGPQAAAGSLTYSTSFPATENPMVDDGGWTQGGVFAGRTNVRTSGGNAFATMTSFDTVNYIDSCAHRAGFPADHEVICTVHNASAVVSLEIEILLRADFSAAHAFAYELDWTFTDKGVALVRWDATVATPNVFDVRRALVSNEATPNDGDQLYGSIVGTVITCKYKPAGGAFSTLFTFDTASDIIKLSSGNPGVGFWNNTGGSTSALAWADFTANAL